MQFITVCFIVMQHVPINGIQLLASQIEISCELLLVSRSASVVSRESAMDLDTIGTIVVLSHIFKYQKIICLIVYTLHGYATKFTLHKRKLHRHFFLI